MLASFGASPWVSCWSLEKERLVVGSVGVSYNKSVILVGTI
jgi:hypothetical protein